MSWRLKWAWREFTDPSGYSKHSQILTAPAQYYLAVLRKLIPALSPAAITLALKDGHVIPVREFMTLYAYKEIFVDLCYDIAVDEPAPTILDIGANTGLFALRMKQLFPLSKITCYEPFPTNFEQLTDTIRVNRLDAVVAVQKAVGARAGSARLYVHKRNLGGHSFYAQQASSDKYIEVEVVELASILDESPGGIDILKADCEGAEFDIVMGLTPSQAGKIRHVIVEPMPKLYDVKQMLDHMSSLGYSHRFRQGLFLFAHA